MSLDIAILGSDGTPMSVAGIGLDTHFSLMQLIAKNPKSFFHRIVDYYTENDCLAEPHELIALQSEVIEILKGKLDIRAINFMEELLKLIEVAKLQGKDLVILSD